MQWLLFGVEAVPLPSGPYHHTIDGQIFTAIVCIAFCVWALWIAYRNFIIHKSTADVVG